MVDRLRMRPVTGKPRKIKPGSGRKKGALSKKSRKVTTQQIRQAARESGMLPMEMLLEAGRTGKLPRFKKGADGKFFNKGVSRELDEAMQMQCLKECAPYYHGKVHPVAESEADAGPSQLITFVKQENLSVLSMDQLQMLESIFASMTGDESAPFIDQKKLFSQMGNKQTTDEADAYAKTIDLTAEDVDEIKEKGYDGKGAGLDGVNEK